MKSDVAVLHVSNPTLRFPGPKGRCVQVKDAIKAQVLDNAGHFLDSLQSSSLPDRDAFAKLCAALDDLAEQWRGASLVDKDLARCLHRLRKTMPDLADVMVERRPELAHELGTMVRDMSGMVMASLNGSGRWDRQGLHPDDVWRPPKEQ